MIFHRAGLVIAALAMGFELWRFAGDIPSNILLILSEAVLSYGLVRGVGWFSNRITLP